jgi:hypothetical protein
MAVHDPEAREWELVETRTGSAFDDAQDDA